MYIPDLRPHPRRFHGCSDEISARRISIGYLDAAHRFPRGEPTEQLLRKLELVVFHKARLRDSLEKQRIPEHPDWPPLPTEDEWQRYKRMTSYVFQWRGWHDCPFCGDGIEAETRFNDDRLPRAELLLGTCDLFITTENLRNQFVCSSLIYHYVAEHHYAPPDAFVETICQIDDVADLAARADAYASECRTLSSEQCRETRKEGLHSA